jgi:hypothetical protein
MLKKNFYIRGPLMLASGILCIQTLFADLPVSASAPQLEIRATDPIALIGASSAAFTVIRNTPTNEDLVVKFDIGGTASNGVNYVKIANSVTIPAGYLASDILIEPLVQLNNRGNKSVVLTLTTNELYNLVQHKTATVTLVDDIFNDLPPTVSLTSPTNGALFTMPANIVITAEASDADDTIQKVSFYDGDDWLGKATNSPFTITWTNVPSGKHTLFARATDTLGKSTLSAPIEIVVTNEPPKITLLSPKDHFVFSLPANVEINGTATDSDDAIAKIEVHGDGRRLGVFTNSPFTLTWSNVPPGKHWLVARASDVFGASSSASVEFSVTNQAPHVSITSPENGAKFPAQSSVTINANATDPDGYIRYVSFYAGSRFLGLATQSPYTIVWKHVPKGTYELKAVAVDRYGSRAISTPITISASK